VKVEELQKLIDASNVLNQGHPGIVEEEWITDAEKRLGGKLPSSYKWWLIHYGCGWIDGYPIYTIAPPEFREAADSDIVTANLAHRKNGIAHPNHIYFYEPDGDERYFFDASEESESAELPVMIENLAEGTLAEYAKDFASFLQETIKLRTR
jgi:hypothetical protein